MDILTLLLTVVSDMEVVGFLEGIFRGSQKYIKKVGTSVSRAYAPHESGERRLTLI